MQKVSMVADKTDLDLGIGVCGKDGQSVPVGVGQPALKIDEITVGGTINIQPDNRIGLFISFISKGGPFFIYF